MLFARQNMAGNFIDWLLNEDKRKQSPSLATINPDVHRGYRKTASTASRTAPSKIPVKIFTVFVKDKIARPTMPRANRNPCLCETLKINLLSNGRRIMFLMAKRTIDIKQYSKRKRVKRKRPILDKSQEASGW